MSEAERFLVGTAMKGGNGGCISAGYAMRCMVSIQVTVWVAYWINIGVCISPPFQT